MTLYDVAKFFHVILAIVWLGGAFGMILLGSIAAKRGEQDNLLGIARNTERLAKLVFVPSTVLILLLGLFMVWRDWSFADAWVLIGLAGVLMTGGFGGLVLTPAAAKLGTMEPGPAAAALAEQFLRNARADFVMLSVIVWDMVSKPAWSDKGEIGAMLAVIVLGGALFLRKGSVPEIEAEETQKAPGA
jgi:uncharacterized membrane protein